MNKLILTSFLLLLSLRIADVLTTLYAVNVLGLTEGNPHINLLAGSFGFTAAMIIYTAMWMLLFSGWTFPFIRVRVDKDFKSLFATGAVAGVNLGFAVVCFQAVFNNLTVIGSVIA